MNFAGTAFPKKWVPFTATFLIGLFLVLSFAAEFSHTHLSSQAVLTFHDQDCEYANEAQAVKTRTSFCIACVYVYTASIIDDQSRETGLAPVDEFRPTSAAIVVQSGFDLPVAPRAPPFIFS